MSSGIPWHVRLRGWLYTYLWPSRYRDHWVRYWESQGISEEQQLEWAAENGERERLAGRDAGS